jgi:hypothetical protein
MSTLLSNINSYTSKQLGENGHCEYAWSNDIREKIIQLNFQLVRTNNYEFNNLQNVYSSLIQHLKHKCNESNYNESKHYLIMLYKMIGYTRDIIDGKGEYNLSYMMIYEWFQYINEDMAFFMLYNFVKNDNNHHPLGSWKDIKYLCNYVFEKDKNINHKLINKSIELINQQIKIDFNNYNLNLNNISLASKWVPREKSNKFGWLFTKLSCSYFSDYMITSNEKNDSYRKAILKCKTEYRKIISCLNKYIDTLQIKQCSKNWSDIDFNKVTSISLLNQKRAFLNIKNNSIERYPNNMDRLVCANNFNNYILKNIHNEVEIKGKRINIGDFTKKAIEIIQNYNNNTKNINYYNESQILNSQWNDNSTQNGFLGKMIPMIDISSSMDCESLNTAISLGIRVAEKSLLGKRILTFNKNPNWIHLEDCNDFISMVQKIKYYESGMNADFYSALDTILDAIIESKLEPEMVQDMILVIFSDMQVDFFQENNNKCLYDVIKDKYAHIGTMLYGVPYKPPHILFWNLRKTNGFPCLFNQPNVSMISGYNPVLLNLFCYPGNNSYISTTPWSILERSLNNKRYKVLEDKARILL